MRLATLQIAPLQLVAGPPGHHDHGPMTTGTSSLGEFFARLLDTDFTKRGECVAWRPEIVWLHVISDSLIAASYYTIPAALLYFSLKRKDVAFSWLFALFAVFIMACGTTHVLGAVAFWMPMYRLDGLAKALTAVVSVATAFAIWRIMPLALALPSPQQLRQTNALLAAEVEKGHAMREELQRAYADLETRIAERTTELSETTARLDTALRRTGTVAFHQDADLRYTWIFNPALGRRAEEVVGQRDDAIFGQADGDLLSNLKREVLRTGHPWRGEVELHDGQNEVLWYDLALDPVAREDGKVIGLRGAAVDVTSRKKVDTEHRERGEQLVQTQKMESLGRLAGGVAHDFNNLLAVMLSYADLALEDLPEDHPARDSVVQIKTSAERAAAITGQLLTFSRKQVLTQQDVVLCTAVSDILGLVQRLVGPRIAMETAFTAEKIAVRTDPAQLHNALLNLAANARDAMPDGGRLRIELDLVELDGDALARLHPSGPLPPGSYAVLTVADTGQGMAPAVKARIFEPFFTTKEPGKGTGLGLAMVYGYVQQSGGFVTVDSAPGDGTAVRLYLPATSGANLPAAAEEPPLTSPELAGTETVLVAEDQPALRDLIGRLLRRAGYRVHLAEDGETALKMAETLGPFDLLLTDVVMGRMNGLELAARLKGTRPNLRVVYMSGYASEVDQATLGKLGRAFVPKPFSPVHLLRSLRAVLDGNGER